MTSIVRHNLSARQRIGLGCRGRDGGGGCVALAYIGIACLPILVTVQEHFELTTGCCLMSETHELMNLAVFRLFMEIT